VSHVTHTELAVLSVPSTGAVAASSDRITRGSVHTVARLHTARSVVTAVTRHVALITAEAHTTLTLTSHRVTDGITSTLAVTGAVLTVAARSTRYQKNPTYCTRRSDSLRKNSPIRD